MKISVITNNSCPNSRAFNCPLLVSRSELQERNIELSFYWGTPSGNAFSDNLFINSNVFRPWWKERKEEIFTLLEKARKAGSRIFWFDTTDSTWCTQFEVMPYVDFFLKSQVFKDRKEYLKRYRTGRIFTDYFADLYNCQEEEANFPLPAEADLEKLGISWNTCFENYNQSRYGVFARLKQKLRPFIGGREKLQVSFTPVDKERVIDVSCRVGTGHSRPSVIAHRQATIEKLEDRGVDCSKISLTEYFRELRNVQIGVGPFGVGEITLRDFEIIICGAALIKPCLDHLETWPVLFKPNETFIPCCWDLSDIDSQIVKLLENPEMRIELANKAQDKYRFHLSHSGIKDFAERIYSWVSEPR